MNLSVHHFSGQLEAHGLIQHLTGANHTRGHTWDVVIVGDIRCIIQGISSVVDLFLFTLKEAVRETVLGYTLDFLSRST